MPMNQASPAKSSIPKGNEFSKYCTSLIYAHYYAYSKVHYRVFFGKVMVATDRV